MTAEANDEGRKTSWGRVLVRAGVLVVAFLGLVAFSVVLAKVTLTPSPASEGIVTSNLHPGRSIRQYAEDYTFLAACKQAGGNILLGAPFGILLPLLVPRRLRMLRMTLLTVLVMVVVELLQGAAVQGRAFDIDDVILNTAGALLGYLVLGRRISHRYHSYVQGTGRGGPAAPDTSTPAPARERFRFGRRAAVAGAPAAVGAKSVPAKPAGAPPAKPAKPSPVKRPGAKDPAGARTTPATGGRALLDRFRNR
ncbi:VanZ family protein [uncultured Streptomyces sp.]|uniref:VanZ family protein n=1 Tax=uncultured Streptomyces sp. TaxID=174707 RepID=UPI002607FAC0|nr:VanZ family protein [uncultured Streptomyces sp.]